MRAGFKANKGAKLAIAESDVEEYPGLWLRGIELDSFDAWAREQASAEVGHMGLSTFFVPHLRVDKVVLDERVGPVPSLSERFETITGRPVESVLKADG